MARGTDSILGTKDGGGAGGTSSASKGNAFETTGANGGVCDLLRLGHKKRKVVGVFGQINILRSEPP